MMRNGISYLVASSLPAIKTGVAQLACGASRSHDPGYDNCALRSELYGRSSP